MDQGIGMQEVWNPGALVRVLTGGYKRIESPDVGGRGLMSCILRGECRYEVALPDGDWLPVQERHRKFT